MVQRDIMQNAYGFGIMFLFTFQALWGVTSKKLLYIIIFKIQNDFMKSSPMFYFFKYMFLKHHEYN